MEHGLMDFVHSIIDLIKFCFNYHWLLGIFIILLLFALVAYVLMFLLLYFIFWAFNTGHYVWGSVGVLFLVYSYWQGRKKKQEAEAAVGAASYSHTSNTNSEEAQSSSSSRAKELPRKEREKEKTSNQRKEHQQQNTKAHESARADFHYKILGCNREDPFSSIQQAYRRLAKEYHPDSFANKPQEFIQLATSKMQEINLAYQHICEERGERR